MTSAAVAFPHLPRACPHARFWHFWHPAEKTVTPCVTQSLALALSLFLAITHGRNPGRNLWPPPNTPVSLVVEVEVGHRGVVD